MRLPKRPRVDASAALEAVLPFVERLGRHWVLGSYGRGESMCHDLDILVVLDGTPDPSLVVPDCLRCLSFDGRKMKILAGERFPVEIWFTDEERLPSAMLYLTGPAASNAVMRQCARKLGMELDFDGLRSSGEIP